MENNNKQRFISLTNDITIKYLYKSNKAWLDKLIKNSLDIDLSDFEEGSNELPAGNGTNKDFRMDFYLKNDKYDVVLIEVQNSNVDSEKNYLYLYRVASNGMNKGVNYSLYTKGVKTLICINNYIPNDDDDKPLKDFVVKSRQGNDKLNYHKKNIIAYEIILPNLKKRCYDELNETEREWYLFLCENYEEMKKYARSEESKEIIDTLKGLSMDEDFLLKYDHEEVYKAMAEGAKQDGIIEGEKNKQLEIAKSMKLEGIESKLIARCTGLTEEEINNL